LQSLNEAVINSVEQINVNFLKSVLAAELIDFMAGELSVLASPEEGVATNRAY
jgi:hypothetical protein